MRKSYTATLILVVSRQITISPVFVADSTSMMNEVVITVSRISESKKDVTANVTVISNEEIKRSAASDVTDLLAEIILVLFKYILATLPLLECVV